MRAIVIIANFVFCFNSFRFYSPSLLSTLFLFCPLGMAQLAYSFCLAVPENGQHRDEEDSFRDLQNACATLSSQNPHITTQFTNEFMVKAQPSSSQHISACNITLTGPGPLVVAAHGELLRENPTKVLFLRINSEHFICLWKSNCFVIYE
jgi:hypothetical protein